MAGSPQTMQMMQNPQMMAMIQALMQQSQLGGAPGQISNLASQPSPTQNLSSGLSPQGGPQIPGLGGLSSVGAPKLGP